MRLLLDHLVRISSPTSGNAANFFLSPRAMHAAVATAIDDAAPHVTIAAGTFSNSAIRAPTFF